MLDASVTSSTTESIPGLAAVAAMEKIDKIFNYLYLKEKASQAEISKDLNIPKATTNRLLYTLVTMGYLYLVGKEYTLGNKFDYF